MADTSKKGLVSASEATRRQVASKGGQKQSGEFQK